MTRRGLSLAELCVYVFLAVLILTLTVYFFIRFLSLGARLQSRADRFRAVNLAMKKLAHDVQQSRAEGISLRPSSPFVLAVNPIAKVQDDGLILWHKSFYIYYLDSEQRLLRRTWPPGDPPLAAEENNDSKAKILSPARLGELASLGPAPLFEVLARDVLEFTVDPNSRDGGLALPLRVRLRVGPVDQPKEQCLCSRAMMSK